MKTCKSVEVEIAISKILLTILMLHRAFGIVDIFPFCSSDKRMEMLLVLWMCATLFRHVVIEITTTCEG